MPGERLNEEEKRINDLISIDAPGIPIKITSGGPSRQDSSRLGLDLVPCHCEFVLVHDAARPFIKPALIRRVREALESGCSYVVPGIAATDTIKRINGENPRTILETVDRYRLIQAQTPQGFIRQNLIRAHEWALGNDFSGTDDAVLLERLGEKGHVVEGDADNIKITYPKDLALLRTEMAGAIPCIGTGYDVHRYGGPRPLRLGGIAIPGGFTVAAHSDGDVLIHALIDAILGCSGLGDIGLHFPDSEQKLENASSAVLLDAALEMSREAGIRLCNVDMTVIAQMPKLSPFREQIRSNVGRLLSLESEYINFKATTEEGLGFTGSGEGIKALVSVSALRAPKGSYQ